MSDIINAAWSDSSACDPLADITAALKAAENAPPWTPPRIDWPPWVRERAAAAGQTVDEWVNEQFAKAVPGPTVAFDDDADELREERDALKAALAELVAADENCDAFRLPELPRATGNCAASDRVNDRLDAYGRRQAAMEKARRLVAAAGGTEGGEQA